MTKEDCRIIFFGTPQFAASTLKAIIEDGWNIVAVITAPDKPAGRGMQMQQSDVKKLALQYHIPVLQPEKLKNPDFLEELKSYDATIQFVVAFRMLPEAVWNMPTMGTYNLHASLLPQYRGAAPINWAIINGESVTGVTTFKLKHEIDTGDILLQEKVIIEPTENVGSLHDKLMLIGANLIVKTLHGLANGDIKEQPQVLSTNTKHAPKIFTETCKIDWNKTVVQIQNHIRGMSPYPTAFTFLNDKKLKIYDCSITPQTNPSNMIGQYETDGKTYLSYTGIDGLVNLLEIQLEGKKRMRVEDFLRGVKL
jgi:methionyl-tRNA formyltransferase